MDKNMQSIYSAPELCMETLQKHDIYSQVLLNINNAFPPFSQPHLKSFAKFLFLFLSRKLFHAGAVTCVWPAVTAVCGCCIMICWVWPCCPCTCTACPPWIWIWPGWTNWICGRKSQKGTLTMPLISPSLASALPNHLWGWFTVAKKKKPLILLFFPFSNEEFYFIPPCDTAVTIMQNRGNIICWCHYTPAVLHCSHNKTVKRNKLFKRNQE